MNHLQKLLLVVIFTGAVSTSMAQVTDTLTVMTYNLMYYRETTSFCTSSNNNVTTKENAMEDIIDYALPDILVVNEMGGSSPVNSFRLLTNSLNQNGRTYYTLCNNTGNGSNLVNMLYYNGNKLSLESQTTVDQDLSGSNLVRLIDIYTLRYNDPNLAQHNDTTRIHVIAAHLKAGSTSADEAERAEATEAVMAYLDTINASGNYLFAGDLNLYRSTEAAYRDLVAYINPSLRFFDPINVSGNWSNNPTYGIVHTQSTRTSGGCFAGGGMDDRFDFILASDEIMNNTDHIEYITNSYQALGQDGARFNGTIISPPNSSVPNAVSQALYNMSDHLPVVMDLKVTLPSTTGLRELTAIKKLKFGNPTTEQLWIDLSNQTEPILKLEVMNLSGQIIASKLTNGRNHIQFDLSNISKGTYLIRITSESYQQKVEKLIKI